MKLMCIIQVYKSIFSKEKNGINNFNLLGTRQHKRLRIARNGLNVQLNMAGWIFLIELYGFYSFIVLILVHFMMRTEFIKAYKSSKGLSQKSDTHSFLLSAITGSIF